MADWNTKLIEDFRANQGQPGGNFRGAHVLLLTTTGARSGRQHTNPLVYLPDDSNPALVYIFATKAGAPTNPDWYYNLVANPTVTLEVGAETFTATATEVKGPERDRIYAKQVTIMPGFGEYERATTRVIPVIALTRD
jgi:deazaflavin-dependent oxidoreductase (nitroreductase family)